MKEFTVNVGLKQFIECVIAKKANFYADIAEV